MTITCRGYTDVSSLNILTIQVNCVFILIPIRAQNNLRKVPNHVHQPNRFKLVHILLLPGQKVENSTLKLPLFSAVCYIVFICVA